MQLTLINRLNHILDRIRLLVGQASSLHEGEADKAQRARQLEILWKRAHWIRAATALVALSALCSASLMVAMFTVTFLHLEAVWFISLFFLAAMLSLILSFLLLMADINQSLSALRLELKTLE